MGDCTLGKDVKGKEIKVYGDIDRCESIVGEEVNIYGDVIAEKAIEGDKLYFHGEVECNGLVNGEEVYISMHGDHKIKEIGGKKIRVSDDIGKKKKLSISLFPFSISKGSGLCCDCIEGDDIMLKNSKVKIVRGHKIIIGEGCEVDKVEYTGELLVLDNAVVRESVIIE